MQETKLNCKGFTLVELIVTLVILSLISAIIMPAFLSYIDDVKTQQDIINAKELMTVGQQLLDEIYYDETPLWIEHNYNDKTTYTGPNFSSVNQTFFINWSNSTDTITYNGKKYTNVRYSKRFKEMAGLSTKQPSDQNGYNENHPFLIGLCVGNYYEYANSPDPRIKRRAYTVYGIIYQRSKDSKAIFFDGNQWNTDLKGIYPFNYGTNPSGYNTLMIDNKPIRITVYFINQMVHPTKIQNVGTRIKDYGFTTVN